MCKNTLHLIGVTPGWWCNSWLGSTKSWVDLLLMFTNLRWSCLAQICIAFFWLDPLKFSCHKWTAGVEQQYTAVRISVYSPLPCITRGDELFRVVGVLLAGTSVPLRTEPGSVEYVALLQIDKEIANDIVRELCPFWSTWHKSNWFQTMAKLKSLGN